jgi:hypothetical protein
VRFGALNRLAEKAREITAGSSDTISRLDTSRRLIVSADESPSHFTGTRKYRKLNS